MAVDRLPPQNIEAEQSVLGSLLIDRDAIIKVAPFLRGEDFYRESHSQIYQAVFNLYEKGEAIDFITVRDALERRDQLEAVGGASYLTALINTPATAAHAEHYAHIVERTATLRRLIDAAGQIASLAYQQEYDLDEAIDRAEQFLFAVSQRRVTTALLPLREILRDYYERIGVILEERGEIIGTPTGFIDLDKLLGGLQPSDLIVVAGRPGMGKTSLVISMAENMAVKHNLSVAFFSLEMSRDQVAQRLLANHTGIDSQRLRLGHLSEAEFERLSRAVGILSEAPIFIDDTPVPSPVEISTKARRLHAEQGLFAIIIDYLQLMQAGQRMENRVQEISFISRRLKALARELDVPVIACSQLSRAVESRPDKVPILSDLRESGSIEQDADVVLFVYREEMYDRDTPLRNIADLIVAKHRHGPTGQLQLWFDRAQARFRDAAPERAEELEF